MKSFCIALLLATASAVSINQRFADGMTDDEIIVGQDQQRTHSRVQAQAHGPAAVTWGKAENPPYCDATNGENGQNCRPRRANEPIYVPQMQAHAQGPAAKVTWGSAENPPFCDATNGQNGQNCRQRKASEPIYIPQTQRES